MPRPRRSEKAELPSKETIRIDGTLDRVESIRLSILEKGKNADPMERRILRVDAVRERVRCHNPLCQGGGFSLGDLLRDLVGSRQEEFVGTSFCAGQEQRHPEVEEFRSCRTRYEVQATLRFRS